MEIIGLFIISHCFKCPSHPQAKIAKKNPSQADTFLTVLPPDHYGLFVQKSTVIGFIFVIKMLKMHK